MRERGLPGIHPAQWICLDPREVDSAVAEDLAIVDAVVSGTEAEAAEVVAVR